MASARSLSILSDAPGGGSDDDLAFRPYADALSLLIDQKATVPPIVIAISAPWGSGKTTVAELVRAQLETNNEWDAPHVTCTFNAWENDDAPHLGAAFAASIAQQLNSRRNPWRRLLAPLPSAMLRPEQRWRRKVAAISLVTAIALMLVFLPGIGPLVRSVFAPSGEGWTVAEKKAGSFGAVILFGGVLPSLSQSY